MFSGKTGAPTKTGEGPNRCRKTKVVGPGESTGASQGGLVDTKGEDEGAVDGDDRSVMIDGLLCSCS